MTSHRRSGRHAATVLSLAFLILVVSAGPCHAQDPLADCDESARRSPGELLSYSCYNFVAMQRGLWTEATTRLEGHVAADPRNTYALGALAYLDKTRGRPRAEELLKRILVIQAERGDTPLAERQWARLELVDFLAGRHRLDEADAVLTDALAEAESSGDVAAIAQVRINQAWQSWRRAEFADAWSILRHVEQEVFPDGDPHTRSIWLSAMGAVHWAQGVNDAARENYERQAAILAEFGDYYTRAGVLFNIALVAIETDDAGSTADPELSLFEAAREAAAAVGNAAVEAAVLAELAGCVETAAERRAYSRRGLELARRANSVDAEMTNLRWLVVSLATEDPILPDASRKQLEVIEDRTREIADPLQTARTMALRAKLDWQAASAESARPEATAKAFVTHREFLESVEVIRRLQPETLSRARTFSTWRSAYAALVTHALDPPGRSPTAEDLELAFEVMERSRSRLLLDEMDAARVTGTLMDPNDPRVRARRQILEAIAGVQKQLLDPSLDRVDRTVLQTELVHLEYDEETARQEILLSEERLATLVEPEIPTLDHLSRVLSPDEAFLTFQVPGSPTRGHLGWESDTHLLVITREHVRSYDLSPAEGIDAAVELFVGLFGNRDGSERGPAARRLYDDLLADAMADLDPGIRRLVIAPDGTLHRLPFVALFEATDPDRDGSRPAITIVPSAAALVRWRNDPYRPAPRVALGLFDPELPFAERDDGQAMLTAGGDSSRALTLWGWRARLPGARAEARAIRRHLGSRVLSVEDGRASEQFLKQAPIADYSILHLAAHAVVDDLDPQRSFVLLAAGGGEDGLLQAREIADLDLDGKVVVLSACSGIAGKGIEAEGVINLARAFLVSGARAVVGSLWPLRDEEAAQFFDRFYARLAEGRSLDDALLKAQGDLAAAGAPAAAWAGLLVVGDGQLTPVEPRPGFWSRAGLFVLVVLALVAAFMAVKFFVGR
jgi:CHAT domain-containing protein/tetratricopeptide (TPR) repeat protein